MNIKPNKPLKTDDKSPAWTTQGVKQIANKAIVANFIFESDQFDPSDAHNDFTRL